MPRPVLLLAGQVTSPADLSGPHVSSRVDTSPSGRQPGPAREGQGPPPAPDAKDLLCVFLAVGGGGDDKQTVQQVNGDAVGALVAGAPDPCTEPLPRGGNSNTWLGSWQPLSRFLATR